MIQDIVLYTFGFFLLLQFYYHFFYFAHLAAYKNEVKSQGHKPVSVVVCAHNEYENLKKLIPLLLTQNYHNYEIVIVNDRSYDETYDFLKEKGDMYASKLKIVNISDLPQKMDPKKYALTMGIKAAKHDLIIFTDADCTPYNNNWILQMQAQATEKPNIILGVSQYQVLPGFLNLLIRFETFYTCIQYLSAAIAGKPYMGVGRNLAYHKSIFFDNKGYHPYMDVTGGDDDLFIHKVANKENTTIAIEIEAQTVSIPKTTFGEWFTQKTRHLSVGKHYKFSQKLNTGLLHFSQLMVIVFTCVLLFDQNYYIYALSGYFLRFLVISIIYSIIIKKLRYNLNNWAIFVVDIIYPFYYIVVGFNALRSKKVKWK